MRSSRSRLAASVLALWLPTAAHASAVSSLALTTGFDGASVSPTSLGAWVGPSLSLEGPRTSMALDLRFLGSSFVDADGAGRLRLATMMRDRGLVRPELVVMAASRSALGTGVRQGVRAHLAGARAGVWISASAEASAGGEQSASLHLPLMGFGAWTRNHHLTVAGTVEQNVGYLRARSAQTIPPDTSVGRVGADANNRGLRFDPQQVVLSSAYASVRWDGDRIELESVGGVTVGALTTPRRWAQARAAWRFSPQLALVATAGSRTPQYFALDPTGERQAALALRFSQSTSLSPRMTTTAARAQAVECRIRRSGDGLWRLMIKAPGARVVEIQGDVTQWQPLALHPMSGERWEGEIEMPPGVHQLGLRVDGGEWLPPPGLPTAPDGFGGTIGVVVIE